MQQQNDSTDGTMSTGSTNGTEDTIGTTSTNGADGAAVGIDPEARRRFVAGAKVGAPARRKQRPWEELDPEAPFDKGMNLRTNAYERALLRQASSLKDGGSMHQTIHELIREGALARITAAGLS